MRGATSRKDDRKSQRLELRLTRSAKATIQRAMAVSGLAAADLAYEGARRVLEDHERMRLTSADREIFLAALSKPPKPARRLINALKRHRSTVV